MNQVQSKGKISTKRANTSNTDFTDAHGLPKKKVLVTSTTSRLILPKPVLTEQQQQQALPLSQQGQVLSQQHILPLPQLQCNFPQQQRSLSQQQYDPQLYSLTNTSLQQQNLNLIPLEIEQVSTYLYFRILIIKEILKRLLITLG
jgi:hypothetical protein